MLNQPESLSDKIPLSSSLKGKELALNWGRQNINHTQRVLLSIHHQIPIETQMNVSYNFANSENQRVFFHTDFSAAFLCYKVKSTSVKKTENF